MIVLVELGGGFIKYLLGGFVVDFDVPELCKLEYFGDALDIEAGDLAEADGKDVVDIGTYVVGVFELLQNVFVDVACTILQVQLA